MAMESPRHLFDVTCVIGSVVDDPTSDLNPMEAAYLMICRHDAQGTFTFPSPNGTMISVTVEFGDPRDST